MAGIIEPPRLAEDADRTGIEWNGSGRLREAGAMTVVVLRVFALLSGLMAAGIVVVEAHSAVYPQIADRIWKNQPYQPDVIIGALKETSRLSPTLACASGAATGRSVIALRALDNALAGHGDLAPEAALPIAERAIDDGLACRPLSAELWLGRFLTHALAEGFRPQLRASFDRAIADAPYDGWMMRLRVAVGSRWFYALDESEQKKFFEDLRYTVDMGFLDDAFTAAGHMGNYRGLLRRQVDQWPVGTRNRFAQFLLSKGIDLRLATDFQLKPWEHY